MGSGGDRRNSWATYAGSAAHRRAYLPAADLLSSPGASELDGPIAQLDDRIARRYSSECPPAARSDSDRRPDAVHPVTADSPIVEGPAARSCRARYSSLRSVRLLSTTAAAPPESFAVAAARFGGFRGHGPDLGRIPLYNRAAEVRSTIASLLAQSYWLSTTHRPMISKAWSHPSLIRASCSLCNAAEDRRPTAQPYNLCCPAQHDVCSELTSHWHK